MTTAPTSNALKRTGYGVNEKAPGWIQRVYSGRKKRKATVRLPVTTGGGSTSLGICGRKQAFINETTQLAKLGKVGKLPNDIYHYGPPGRSIGPGSLAESGFM